MTRVVGIGGVFLKSRDSETLAKWYGETLGLKIEPWGGVCFPLRERKDAPKGAMQVWSLFRQDTDYFAPSTREVMVNFEVDDLDAMLARLTEKGVTILGRDDSDPNGSFAWFLDPEGTKVELWQPKDKS